MKRVSQGNSPGTMVPHSKISPVQTKSPAISYHYLSSGNFSALISAWIVGQSREFLNKVHHRKMVLNPGNLPGGMFEWRVPVYGDNAVYEQKDKKKNVCVDVRVTVR